MRPIFLALALIIWPTTHGWADNAPQSQSCQKPDETLIKFRGGYGGRLDLSDSEKIKLYNRQGHAFNECIDKLIDSNNAETKRIKNDGDAAIASIANIANRQQADIVVKVKAAIQGQQAVAVTPNITSWQFPDADCVVPDKALLDRVRGSQGATETSITRTAQYDVQQQTYRTCVNGYIGQAAAEMRVITDNANTRIKIIADKANARSRELHDQIKDWIRTANDAAASEADIVRGTVLELPPDRTFGDGVESVIVEGQRPLEVTDTPKGEGDPNSIICRKPQQLPESRLLGPEICKRNRVWAALFKAGKDISSDGNAIVPSEKARTLDHAARACTKVTMGGGYQGYMTNEYCN